MTDPQKYFPLSLTSEMDLVNSDIMELWSWFRFSDFIPIIPLDFPVNFWKSPEVNICDSKRSNNHVSEEDLPALLCVIFYLFWCTPRKNSWS